jgi:hypothetical protein
MKSWILFRLILIAGCANYVLGQGQFFTKLHQLNAYGFHFTVEKVNEGFMLFSRSLDSLTLTDKVYITKVDELGNIIWSKGYGDTQHQYYPGWFRSFGMLADSSFYAGGNRYYSPGVGKMVLFRFDKNGDTLFTKEYGGPTAGFDVGQTARKTSDGGFVLAGVTNTMGRGRHDFYIVKTDSLGNMEWERAVGEYKDDDAFDMEITANGDIYVTGQSESFWGTPPGAIQPCVAKLNSSGDVLWFKNYNTLTPEYDRGSIGHFGKINDTTFVVLAARIKQNSGFSEMSVIFKIDSSGNTLWQREYSDDEIKLDIGSTLINIQDGSFLVGGGVYIPNDTEIQDAGVICHFDSSGNVVKMKRFYEPGYKIQESIFDMIPTPDGIAAVGFATAPQTPWMVKIDSNLCFGPDSCGPNLPVSRVAESYPAQQTLLLPYPNPSPDGVFSIRLPQRLTDQPTLRQSHRPNMMDPLGSDFPHIHRDASTPARKKSPAPGIHFSDNTSIHLQAFDLQGREIPLEISIHSELLQVKLKQGSVRGMVVLKMQIGEEDWYGKIWVE